MKPIFTLLLLASGLLAKSAPAETDPAVKAFEAAYGKSTPATWHRTAAGRQVEFQHKGQYITAVYTAAGQLRWYTKHIISTSLPVSLQLGLKDGYADYWIADVQEKSGQGGAAYVLTLENAERQVVLKSVGGKWQRVAAKRK